MSSFHIRTAASKVESTIGYVFTNKLLCAEAVQMAAPTVEVKFVNTHLHLQNNKRLAVLGDAVLARHLCEKWYEAGYANGRRLPLCNWTQLRNDVLSNSALADRGYRLRLDECIFVNPGISTISSAMVAMTFEAVFGAVCRDGGDVAVHGVMQRLGFFEHPFLRGKSSNLNILDRVSLSFALFGYRLNLERDKTRSN